MFCGEGEPYCPYPWCNIVFTRMSATAFIKFTVIRVRRLLKIQSISRQQVDENHNLMQRSDEVSVISCGSLHIYKNVTTKPRRNIKGYYLLLASWIWSTTELAFWVNYSSKRLIRGAALITVSALRCWALSTAAVNRVLKYGSTQFVHCETNSPFNGWY